MACRSCALLVNAHSVRMIDAARFLSVPVLHLPESGCRLQGGKWWP